MPSVFTQTLGKATIFLFTGKRLRRVHLLRHSAKFESLPSARRVALGKEPNFAECCQIGTRQSLNFCRVPWFWYSAKFSTSRSVRLFVRRVSTIFAECGLAHGKGLPSAQEKTLGKAGFAGRRKAVCASPSATLGKEFAECFSAFAECL